MSEPVPWELRVADLRDRASDALDADRVEDAVTAIDDAFALIDREGTTEHVVFASLLCVAADAAFVIADLDSASTLYQRAANIARRTEADPALVAKAVSGQGGVELARGHRDAARLHCEQAIALLASSSHPDAENGRAAIAEMLTDIDGSSV